jgi:dipeptidyl aminopeptidase/acylaminoacyl peptidase
VGILAFGLFGQLAITNSADPWRRRSLLLARELAARGIPYRDIAIPNERHGFFRHASWLTSYRASEEFLDEMLKAKEPSE